MASRYSTITGTSATSSLSIASGTALKTILQLAASSSSRDVLIEFGISFDGVTATNAPVEVRLQRQTSAGSNGLTGVIQKVDNGPSAGSTVLVGPTAAGWTTEPTPGDILSVWRVPPTSGLVMQYPLGREPVLEVSTRLALVVAAAQTVNVQAYLVWEE